MPNKLTDAEVKKAFECCYTDKGGCDECPYYSREENRCIEDGDFFDLPNKIFDLINRQTIRLRKVEHQLDDALKMGEIINAENVSLKAEVERLKVNEEMAEGYADALVEYTKAEAYKECIEKVKDLRRNYTGYAFDKMLDNLLNELVGDDNFANIDKQN